MTTESVTDRIVAASQPVHASTCVRPCSKPTQTGLKNSATTAPRMTRAVATAATAETRIAQRDRAASAAVATCVAPPTGAVTPSPSVFAWSHHISTVASSGARLLELRRGAREPGLQVVELDAREDAGARRRGPG